MDGEQQSALTVVLWLCRVKPTQIPCPLASGLAKALLEIVQRPGRRYEEEELNGMSRSVSHSTDNAIMKKDDVSHIPWSNLKL